MALDILAAIGAWSASVIHPYLIVLSNIIAALALALWGKDIFYQKVGRSGKIPIVSNLFQGRKRRFVAFVFEVLVGGALIFLVVQKIIEWFLVSFEQYILWTLILTLFIVWRSV